MASSKSSARSIEQLKSEYEQLNKRKIQAQTQLEEAEKQLTSLQEESNKEFGTSDINELTKKLEQMEAENEKQRRDYQDLLDRINQDLKDVEEGKVPAGKIQAVGAANSPDSIVEADSTNDS